jgi:hypothetical protein
MRYIITEQQLEHLKDSLYEKSERMSNLIKSYLDRNLSEYKGVKKIEVKYSEEYNSYHVNIFFDRKLAIELGGRMNSFINKATSKIGDDATIMFDGLHLRFYQHFED